MPGSARLLDLGCGNATSLAWLCTRASWRVFGIDLSYDCLSQSGANEVSCAQADAVRLPFSGGSFDILLLECSLSIILTNISLQAALSEFRRILRSGGRLLISDLYARRPEFLPTLRLLPSDNPLAASIDLPGLEQALSRNGFSVLHCAEASQALRGLSAAGAASFEEAALYARARPGYFTLIAAHSGSYSTNSPILS